MLAVLAQALLAALRARLPGYAAVTPDTIHRRFLETSGQIITSGNTINVRPGRRACSPACARPASQPRPSPSWTAGRCATNTHERCAEPAAWKPALTVIDALKAAFVLCRLSRSELARRAGPALESRAYAELAGATAGIPAGRAATAPPRQATAPARARPASWKVIAPGCERDHRLARARRRLRCHLPRQLCHLALARFRRGGCDRHARAAGTRPPPRVLRQNSPAPCRIRAHPPGAIRAGATRRLPDIARQWPSPRTLTCGHTGGYLRTQRRPGSFTDRDLGPECDLLAGRWQPGAHSRGLTPCPGGLAIWLGRPGRSASGPGWGLGLGCAHEPGRLCWFSAGPAF
jgi:hypothetical protein